MLSTLFAEYKGKCAITINRKIKEYVKWCPGRDSNSHAARTLEPKSSMSTNSITWARPDSRILGVYGPTINRKHDFVNDGLYFGSRIVRRGSQSEDDRNLKSDK